MAKEEENDAAVDEEGITVQEGIQIDDGLHEGKIENIVHEKRGEEAQYNYIDLYVQLKDVNDEDVTIKVGFPAYITVNSSFGKLLKASGFEFAVGQKVTFKELKTQLIDKVIAFKTVTEDQFARIIQKTIKFV